MVEILREMFENQIKSEKDPGCHLDMAADPTATMLSKVCGLIPDEVKLRTKVDPEKVKRILSTFGYYFGRWIYLVDAADDYDDDIRHGSFNAFAEVAVTCYTNSDHRFSSHSTILFIL
jgi:hypothetical protein